MRSKQAAKNMVANIILQGIVFLSGIILPRFFLEEYGSSINGMVSSVNQFLVYLSLAEAGVGTASTVALYKPLADGDQNEINGVLSATRRFYYRSGYIFSALVAGLVLLYPYMIAQQLSVRLVRTMILILASSTLVDYLLLGKYKVLLVANQRSYVVAYVQAAGTLLNMTVSITLIHFHVNVLLVKAFATFVYIIRFLVIKWYVKKYYKNADFKAPAKMDRLGQREAAFLHQVVGVISNNTDVVLLTICLGSRSLIEVSVYSIYNMVVSALNMIFNSFSDSLTAGFGEIFSKGEERALKKSFSDYEYIYMIFVFLVFICMGVLLLPFVAIYTQNVKDANYIRPVSAWLFTMMILLQNIRIPGLTIICAAGHFKETRSRAVLEAAINITVSLALVWKYGMNGVLMGTMCSYGYRSIDVILYNRKYLVRGSGAVTFRRIVRNLLVSSLVLAGCLMFVPQSMDSFITWAVYALITAMISAVCLVAVNYLCEKNEFYFILERVRSMKK